MAANIRGIAEATLVIGFLGRTFVSFGGVVGAVEVGVPRIGGHTPRCGRGRLRLQD
jgi:hypothetical protein